jgi:hypothetical protein
MVDESCVAVAVPQNGFLDSYGRGWSCERGFERVGNSCVIVEVPTNAHLRNGGHGWSCDRGFRREVDRCAPDTQ